MNPSLSLKSERWSWSCVVHDINGGTLMLTGPIIALIVVIFILFSSLKVLQEYERGVVFRLGRIIGAKGPGVVVIIPGVDRLIRISLRIMTTDVPPQDVVTKDNVSIQVNAVILFRVVDPNKAVNNVESYLESTYQYAQTTLRSVLGSVELDEVLSEREALNKRIQSILDLHTEPWGVKVSAVEIKQVDLPKEMQRAMAQQAEAERQRRAKIIMAEGEAQAAEKLVDAAKRLQEYPAAIQLRYLQTLGEIAAENNSTTIFPVPLEMLGALLGKFNGPEIKFQPSQKEAPKPNLGDRS